MIMFRCSDSIKEAIVRERQIKGWYRQWKVKLIEKDNPEWADLGGGVYT